MTSFSGRVAKHFLVINAAKEFKKEIEKAGLDNLKILADNGAVGRARTAGLVVSIPLFSGDNSHTLYQLSYDGLIWVGE